MPSFSPVRAIVRGLDVLRVVSDKGPVTATEIARALKIPQPTTIRILETLIDAGYVYRDEAVASFSVTARTLALSSGYDATSRLVQLARPLIEDLRRRIGWPSNLAVPGRDSMIIAYTNRGAASIPLPGHPGATTPLLATGVGMVYLASLGPVELAAVLQRLRASKDKWNAEPALWQDLDGRLEQVRQTGCGFAHEDYLYSQYQSRIWAVAVPIMVGGRLEAAISSLLLQDTGDRERQLALVLPQLQNTAGQIADALAADRGLPRDPGPAGANQGLARPA